MTKRGRPKLTDEQAALEAAKIIEVAVALRYHPAQLAQLGFESKVSAFRFVSKRYRGRIGEFVGASVRNLLFFPEQSVELPKVYVPAYTWEVKVYPGEKPRTGREVAKRVTMKLTAANKTEIAVQLVLDHGLTHYRAAKATKIHLTNLKRALPAARAERLANAKHLKKLRRNTQIMDVVLLKPIRAFFCQQTRLLKK